MKSLSSTTFLRSSVVLAKHWRLTRLRAVNIPLGPNKGVQHVFVALTNMIENGNNWISAIITFDNFVDSLNIELAIFFFTV